MTRCRIVSIVTGAMLAALLAGCGLVQPLEPLATVTLYGQNRSAIDSWFALVPLQDPPESVGFGADGVACLQGPVGYEIVRFQGSPGRGGRVVENVATVVGGDQPGANVFWVSVAADGTLTKGEGVPEWWVGDPQEC